MPKFAIYCIACLFLIGSARAEEDLRTTGKMLEFCRGIPAAQRAYQEAICVGRIDGFEAGFTAHSTWTRVGICIPDKTTKRQVKAVFVKWAEQNPETWNEPWGLSLVNSLIDAWPCPK